MIVFFIVWFVVCILVLFLFICYGVGKSLDERGLEVKKKTRYRRKTYDDGFGKYIVDVKEEEWVTVPKDENKK